ncbi:UNVERIFIED_CONTAM: hypothetical protein HDU68_012770 [Siphonaria sp. JEL0065]|nr:hypothetical protein HDU68_012770 [Siphonaria sp. JEL0065]
MFDSMLETLNAASNDVGYERDHEHESDETIHSFLNSRGIIRLVDAAGQDDGPPSEQECYMEVVSSQLSKPSRMAFDNHAQTLRLMQYAYCKALEHPD